MLGHGPFSASDLTPDLTIPDDKIAGYLLNVDHPKGGPKAKFFLSHGFSLDAPEPFIWALFGHGKRSHLVEEAPTEFGTKYVYEGPMQMVDGSMPRVRSVWFKPLDDFRVFLVTAYPF